MSRAAYYKWLNRETPENELENRRIATLIEEIHNGSPDKGYRRIKDELKRYHGIDVNDKRILRICRSLGIKSTIKYANDGCTRQSSNPQFIAENILNREFTAEAPNQKWLTDVTEFHYYTGIEKHKIYLSAILDLFDRRTVLVTAIIIRWCLIPLIMLSTRIQMPIRCFIAIEDSSIQTEHFMQRLKQSV